MVYCTDCGSFLDIDTFFCPQCGLKKELTRCNPLALTDERLIIEHYFHQNYKYEHIVVLLEIYHGIEMGIRTLKRRLRTYGLKKHQCNITIPALRRIITNELEGPGSLRGYRSMWHHLRISYGIIVRRDTVMQLIKEIDPQGNMQRRRNRLNRRQYRSLGANQCWHVDGYDKLKPYGLPIHGAIDGFSRKIIWLRVCRSNNNPVMPASFYINSVEEFGFCPQKLRTDLGTENGIMADMHCFLVNNADSHSYGTSVANQRIENWWSSLKKGFTSWVIDFFKGLIEDDLLIIGHNVHMECVWFVFSRLLQKELDEVRYSWNTHYIRRSRNDTIPGIPDINFYAPIISGFENKKVLISEDTIQNVLRERNVINEAAELERGDNADLTEFFQYVVHMEALSYPPKNWNEARFMYQTIISKCY